MVHPRCITFSFIVIGVIFYSLQVWLAFRGRKKIIDVYNKVILNNISRSEIDVLYEKLSTTNTNPDLQRALSANKNQLNSLINTMNRLPQGNYGNPGTAVRGSPQRPSLNSNSASATGWQKTNSFSSPSYSHQTSSLQPQVFNPPQVLTPPQVFNPQTIEGASLLHNTSVNPANSLQ